MLACDSKTAGRSEKGVKIRDTVRIATHTCIHVCILGLCHLAGIFFQGHLGSFGALVSNDPYL